MEQIFTALDSKQLAGRVFLDVTKKRHLIPLIILPYVINWPPMVHRLKLSHGSNQRSASWKGLLEILTLPFKHACSVFHRPLPLAPLINDLLAHRVHKGQSLGGGMCPGVPLCVGSNMRGIKVPSQQSVLDRHVTWRWLWGITSFAVLHLPLLWVFINLLPRPLPYLYAWIAFQGAGSPARMLLSSSRPTGSRGGVPAAVCSEGALNPLAKQSISVCGKRRKRETKSVERTLQYPSFNELHLCIRFSVLGFCPSFLSSTIRLLYRK